MAEQNRGPLTHFHIMGPHTSLAHTHTHCIVSIARIQVTFCNLLVTRVMWFYPNGNVSVGDFVGLAGWWFAVCINNLEHTHTHTHTRFPMLMLQHAAVEEKNAIKWFLMFAPAVRRDWPVYSRHPSHFPPRWSSSPPLRLSSRHPHRRPPTGPEGTYTLTRRCSRVYDLLPAFLPPPVATSLPGAAQRS